MTDSVPSQTSPLTDPLLAGAPANGALAGLLQLFAAPSSPAGESMAATPGEASAVPQFAELLASRESEPTAASAAPLAVTTQLLRTASLCPAPMALKGEMMPDAATAVLVLEPIRSSPVSDREPTREQAEDIAALAQIFLGVTVAPLPAKTMKLPEVDGANVFTTDQPLGEKSVSAPTPVFVTEAAQPAPARPNPTVPGNGESPSHQPVSAPMRFELRLPDGRVYQAEQGRGEESGASVERVGVTDPSRAELQVSPAAVSVSVSLPTKENLPFRVGAEKNAAPLAEFQPVEIPQKNARLKIALSADAASVEAATGKVGIGVAKLGDDMPALAQPFAEAPTAPEARAPLSIGFPRNVFVPDHSAIAEESAAPAVVAHRAVQTVMSAVELQALNRLNAQPGVHLRLQVGDHEVAVRIAIDDGQVRTEFRTDSAPLRVALQSEWQASVSRSDLPVQFLAPVFTGNNSSSPAAFNSALMAGHEFREQARRQAEQEQFGRVARSYPADSVEDAPVTSLTPVANPLSVHLSAVA